MHCKECGDKNWSYQGVHGNVEYDFESAELWYKCETCGAIDKEPLVDANYSENE